GQHYPTVRLVPGGSGQSPLRLWASPWASCRRRVPSTQAWRGYALPMWPPLATDFAGTAAFRNAEGGGTIDLVLAPPDRAIRADLDGPRGQMSEQYGRLALPCVMYILDVCRRPGLRST